QPVKLIVDLATAVRTEFVSTNIGPTSARTENTQRGEHDRARRLVVQANPAEIPAPISVRENAADDRPTQSRDSPTQRVCGNPCNHGIAHEPKQIPWLGTVKPRAGDNSHTTGESHL